MKDISRFRALGLQERALVAVAVLLDGHDAADYLSSDKQHNLALSRAARDLAELPPDLRMPLLGSLLRKTLEQME
jgi:hypothetical protein